MARRRRLEPVSDAELAAIRAEALTVGEDASPRAPLGAPPLSAPIARVAADSVAAQAREIAALRADVAAVRAAADQLAQAESAGLLIECVDIADIDLDYLARDRLPRGEDDEDWRALKQSIRAHGQRTPVDLARLEGDARRYGLISGRRRIAAAQALAAETGAVAQVRALIRTPATLAQAFVGMVEENEIRAGLSYYERARVCVLAVGQGAFDSPDAALDALFAAASAPKRSKIRSFIRLVEEIGDLLRFPEEIGERLGLRLAAALKQGRGGVLRRCLGEETVGALDAAQEQAALTRCLEQGGRMIPRRRRDPQAGAERRALRPLANGGALELWLRDDRASFRLTGSLPSDLRLTEALEALARALERP